MAVSVQNTGMVTSVDVAELSTSCVFDFKWFPYDTQICELVFASSAHDINKV